MTVINYRSIFLTAMLILSACSSINTAPEKTYYVLQNDVETRLTEISGKPTVSIRYVKLPSYLNQRGIARILENGQANVSYTDLWADKLSLSIPALISENLSVALRSPVETHPLPPGISVNSIVEVNISHFIGDKNTLTLKSNYRLIKSKELKSYRFDTQIALDDNNTTTLVKAYAQAIQKLSADIGRNL